MLGLLTPRAYHFVFLLFAPYLEGGWPYTSSLLFVSLDGTCCKVHTPLEVSTKKLMSHPPQWGLPSNHGKCQTATFAKEPGPLGPYLDLVHITLCANGVACYPTYVVQLYMHI